MFTSIAILIAFTSAGNTDHDKDYDDYDNKEYNPRLLDYRNEYDANDKKKYNDQDWNRWRHGDEYDKEYSPNYGGYDYDRYGLSYNPRWNPYGYDTRWNHYYNDPSYYYYVRKENKQDVDIDNDIDVDNTVLAPDNDKYHRRLSSYDDYYNSDNDWHKDWNRWAPNYSSHGYRYRAPHYSADYGYDPRWNHYYNDPYNYYVRKQDKEDVDIDNDIDVDNVVVDDKDKEYDGLYVPRYNDDDKDSRDKDSDSDDNSYDDDRRRLSSYDDWRWSKDSYDSGKDWNRWNIHHNEYNRGYDKRYSPNYSADHYHPYKRWDSYYPGSYYYGHDRHWNDYYYNKDPLNYYYARKDDKQDVDIDNDIDVDNIVVGEQNRGYGPRYNGYD